MYGKKKGRNNRRKTNKIEMGKANVRNGIEKYWGEEGKAYGKNGKKKMRRMRQNNKKK